MMNNFEAKLCLGVFSLAITYVKGNFRNMLQRDGRKKSCQELLDELKERVTDLEIKASIDDATFDLEKKAKENDLAVKNKVSKALGLFEVKPTNTVPLSPEGGKKDTRYICGEILKSGDRLVLVSPPGAGKSVWSTQVSICLSEGREPEFVKDGKTGMMAQIVEYYDAELDSDDRSSRYGGYNASSLFHLHAHCRFRTFYYLLDDINGRVSCLSSDVTVVIDNVFAVMPGMTPDETRTFLEGLDIIQNRLLEKGVRLTIILVTHTGKDVVGIPRLKDVAGSAHFSRFAKSVMSLFVRKDGKTVLVTNKRRYAGGKNALIMRMSNEGYLHLEYVNEESVNIDSLEVEEDSEEEENSSPPTDAYPHEMRIEMWKKHRKEGVSLRGIAEYFKQQGVSVTHTTVSKFINQIDGEMKSEANKEEGE